MVLSSPDNNIVFDFVTGRALQAPENSRQAEEVAGLLRASFPHLGGLSAEKTLLEGLGFHDMASTTWIVARRDDRIIVGTIVGIAYHNGLYLQNFCVAPEFRGRGIGLDLLEVASQFAVGIGAGQGFAVGIGGRPSRLIGNANSDDRYIIDYYSGLGARVIRTGHGGGGDEKNNKLSSTVRFEREIPGTSAGVVDFFEDLRVRRRKSRRNRTIIRTALGITILLVAVGVVSAFVLTGSKREQRGRGDAKRRQP